jgi:hypothetical protein
VDLVVFGRLGKLIAGPSKMDWQELPDQPNAGVALKLENSRETKGEKAGHIRAASKAYVRAVFVFRNEMACEALSELVL